MDITPLNYLINLRMEKAKELLRNTNMLNIKKWVMEGPLIIKHRVSDIKQRQLKRSVIYWE